MDEDDNFRVRTVRHRRGAGWRGTQGGVVATRLSMHAQCASPARLPACAPAVSTLPSIFRKRPLPQWSRNIAAPNGVFPTRAPCSCPAVVRAAAADVPQRLLLPTARRGGGAQGAGAARAAAHAPRRAGRPRGYARAMHAGQPGGGAKQRCCWGGGTAVGRVTGCV